MKEIFMKRLRTKMIIGLGILLLAGAIGGLISGKSLAGLYYLPAIFNGNANNNSGYVVLAWNDLGMHCYNRNFQDLGVLPPYNNLWAQVVKVADPPQIITKGIEVSYEFPNNTYSVGKPNFVDKSNFWTYAQQLFGLAAPLQPNIGLTGKGLSGAMDLDGDHFKVEGIPLTEFQDTAPTTSYPYQLATVIVRDAQTKVELARTITVAPVSTEMHCDTCHKDGGVGGIATGSVEQNILTFHDQEEGTNLMASRPVLCANCHASNALAKPGKPGVPNFSRAMHGKHSEVMPAPNSLNDCYKCHPGPQTQCLRDVMFQSGKTCTTTECHGNLDKVSQNPNPWLNEPKCTTCHTNIIQDQALYRQSTGHKGIRCAACHDSPHAIAPTREPNDWIKFQGWQGQQGEKGPLRKCTVCHLTQPTSSMPHGK
jgi:hypothetical protein